MTVHVIAAVSLLGTDLVLVALGVAGARGAEPATVYPAAALVAGWLTAPLAVAALATGIAQGLTTHWGLLRHWWVTVKLSITAIMVPVLLLMLVPGLERAAALATGPTPHLITDAQQLRLAIAPAAAAALLRLNVVLAMYKPRHRTSRGRGEPRERWSRPRARSIVRT